MTRVFVSLWCGVVLLLAAFPSLAAERPNILWITFEDSSPHLGCYGDREATTPRLDELAARGIRFRTAWSNAPVCAPARTCLISGRWAPSDGAEQMRSEVPLPAGHKMYPQLLREAGYYCTNNSKEDYNLTKPSGVWDDSSGAAHWKGRRDGQPFFAIFNITVTHESQIRRRPHSLTHDPAKVTVPPYHPDTPEVRHDWAQHFDNVSTMDTDAGKRLKEIADAGLANDTIVFCYSDHGTGMPRGKRWAQSSGLRVPFLLYFPEKWKHLAPKDYAAGTESSRLVQFIDMAPTALSLAGIQPPEYMHGRAFAGAHAAPPRDYIFGFRGRMDERYDLVRSVTDGRYVYVRHFMPHLPEGQHVNYMFEQATTRVWHQQFVAGKLSEVQAAVWREKPSEKLYDLQSDPWETNNLAESAEHAATKKRLRDALTDWLISTRDLGFIPEAQRLAEARGDSPADRFRDETSYPVREVLNAALLATDRSQSDVAPIAKLLEHSNAAIRYWGAIGVQMRGAAAVTATQSRLVALLKDPSPSVRVAVAESLALHSTADRAAALDVLFTSAVPKNGSSMEATEALNSLDRLGTLIAPHKDRLANIDATAPSHVPSRLREYPSRLIEYMATTLDYKPSATVKTKAGAKKKG